MSVLNILQDKPCVKSTLTCWVFSP